jgi:hypothetical protein
MNTSRNWYNKPGGGRNSCGDDGDGEVLTLEGPATALAESPFIETTAVERECGVDSGYNEKRAETTMATTKATTRREWSKL